MVSTHAWAYVEKRAKYFERRTHYYTTLGNV